MSSLCNGEKQKSLLWGRFACSLLILALTLLGLMVAAATKELPVKKVLQKLNCAYPKCHFSNSVNFKDLE